MRRARILIVTSVKAERDAVASRLERGGDAADVEVLAAGVGPAAAAAGAATALATAAAAGTPFALAVSAGIAGGFGQPLGGTVVASSIVAADLGAVIPPAAGGEAPTGFVSVAELGFGTVEHRPPPALVRAVAEATGAASGPVLTVSTVTGTAGRARELASRHPGAVAEAMEGFGVAEAAAVHGVPALELRAVSNSVGPRDRAAWRIPEALDALGTACAAMLPVLRAWKP
ncbi:futalosine hydrolase [Streptomyces winkii]|uniref:futalosine hydrolase n=1 Tax=Streptomyces winkii TaxID=3051178 RepID=UPI0028D0BD39|nr:futalosine hydrolase [Streptomyces sp. DSM 40971]